jgi:hypothetical protein
MTDDAVKLAREVLESGIDTAHDGWCRDERLTLARAVLSIAAERDRLVATIAAAESVQYPLYALAPVVDKQAAMIDRFREALAEALCVIDGPFNYADPEWRAKREARLASLRKLVGG